MAAQIAQEKVQSNSSLSTRRWAGQANSQLWAAAGYAGMIFCLLLIGLPVYWMVIGAFNNSAEVYWVPPTWFPQEPTLANFPKAWQSAPFGGYYHNTLITTLLGSGFEIFFAVTSAYAFTFLRFPKKEALFLILLAAMMVPSQVTVLPNYLTIAALGWINTYQGIVLPGAAVA